MNNIQKLYYNKIKRVKKISHPRILINICCHGNEIIGLDVKKLCKKLKIIHGSITFNTANPKALATRKRYIESDLNRSFPGSKTGTYEEQIANQMMKYVKLFDYVFDIHSTESDMENSLIIEDTSSKIQKMISVCKNANVVLYMSATKGSSIFTACRQTKSIIPGLAFEYGKDPKKTYEDLIGILKILGIIAQSLNTKLNHKNPNQFKCYATFPKYPGDILSDDIKDYKLIYKGDIIGYSVNKKPIIAPKNFYPVLFRETNYKTFFGFMAKKM